MDSNTGFVFTHASEIAERRIRRARKLQSQEVGRAALGPLSALRRGVVSLRQALVQAARP